MNKYKAITAKISIFIFLFSMLPIQSVQSLENFDEKETSINLDMSEQQYEITKEETSDDNINDNILNKYLNENSIITEIDLVDEENKTNEFDNNEINDSEENTEKVNENDANLNSEDFKIHEGLIQKIIEEELNGANALNPEIKSLENLDIVSSTIITKEDAKRWAKSKKATDTFINLADLYWAYAPVCGNVNPAIAYVQAALETGYGKFGGVLDETYCNPCGMKNPIGGDDLDPNAHYRFGSWNEGVKGHLDHLALYAGAKGYPKAQDDTFDPRHFYYIWGVATTVKDLEGRWATSTGYTNTILKLYNEALEIAKKPSKVIVDTPTNGIIIKDNNIKVSGWALNYTGIKEVKVYVDGKYNTNAEIGKLRNDVDKAFPGYFNGQNSGYTASLDINTIAPGRREITVEAIGNDDTSIKTTRIVNVEKAPSKLVLDTPANNITLSGGKLNISGWALNASGVKEVNLYVNNEYRKTIEVNISRPDVNKLLPGYPGGENSGFQTSLDFSELGAGNNEIKVEAIGNDGSTHSVIRNIKVEKPLPKLLVDTVKNNMIVTGDSLKISGWSINYSTVKEIKIYIDNQYIDSARLGISRPDVYNAFSQYPNSENSGYSITLSMNNIAPGKRVIKIESIGNDGSVISVERIIDLQKKPSKLALDTPVNGSTITNMSLNIRGWALNASGVKEIKVYIDNKYMETTNTGVVRADVEKVFPGYPNSKNSGYSIIIDLSNIPVGRRELKVEAIGNDGTVHTVKSIINVKRDKLIVVDSGHGGSDPGAVAVHDGIRYEEAVLSMQVSIKLKNELENLGYKVAMTVDPIKALAVRVRTVSLKERADYANSLNADALISIHHDSSNSSSANGVSTFYSSWKSELDNTDIVEGKDPNGYTWYDLKVDLTPTKEANKGKELAKNIVDNLSLDANYYNKKEHDRNLYVTKNTKMPAVLVECGFLSNPEEAKKAADPNNQDKIAKSIAKSVLNTIK